MNLLLPHAKETLKLLCIKINQTNRRRRRRSQQQESNIRRISRRQRSSASVWQRARERKHHLSICPLSPGNTTLAFGRHRYIHSIYVVFTEEWAKDKTHPVFKKHKKIKYKKIQKGEASPKSLCHPPARVLRVTCARFSGALSPHEQQQTSAIFDRP